MQYGIRIFDGRDTKNLMKIHLVNYLMTNKQTSNFKRFLNNKVIQHCISFSIKNLPKFQPALNIRKGTSLINL